MWCVVLLLGIVFSANALSRPHYLKPCSISHDFNECARKHALYAIPFLLNGDRQLKIPSMNPLKIPLVDLKGSNQFHLRIRNMEVHGLDKVVLVDVSADFNKRTLDVNSTVEKLTILGDYEIDGKIMVFPLTGQGRLEITLHNGIYQYGVNWDFHVRKGKRYAKLVNSTYDYKLDRMSFNFENLFNGDKMLGDQMNKFLNENWEIVNEDLKKAIVETLLAIHTDIATKIYSQIPFDDLFLE